MLVTATLNPLSAISAPPDPHRRHGERAATRAAFSVRSTGRGLPPSFSCRAHLHLAAYLHSLGAVGTQQRIFPLDAEVKLGSAYTRSPSWPNQIASLRLARSWTGFPSILTSRTLFDAWKLIMDTPAGVAEEADTEGFSGVQRVQKPFLTAT